MNTNAPITEDLLFKIGFKLDHSKQSWHHRTFVFDGFELSEIMNTYQTGFTEVKTLQELQALFFEDRGYVFIY